jgi:hypothetical protein
MAGKRTRKILHQNAELRSPVVDAPAITGGTLTTPTLTNPAVTTGTFDTPALTTPTLTGALTGGTLNTDLSGAAAAIDGNVVEADTNPTVLPTNATVAVLGPQVKKLTITLAADTLDIEAANDFGALQLTNDLPAAYRIVACSLALTFTHSDLAGDASTVDVALGTVTTASTDFSNAGEDDVRGKIDATGTTTGTIAGATAVGASEIPGVTTDLFLNASSPVTAGTGVLTLTGDIDLWYIPLL